MRYYIDLGAYDGGLLSEVVDKFPLYDYYIAFEPILDLCKKIKKRFNNNNKISVIQKAISTIDSKNQKFYISFYNEKRDKLGSFNGIGKGSSLLKKKGTGELSGKNFIKVKTINFSKYIINNFKKEDHIDLKIDIEGKEYDLLEHMIETGSIFYINKIYCEWHYHKIKKHKKNYHNVKLRNKKRHDELIKKLNKLGFELKGNNTDDEMQHVMNRLNNEELGGY
jgi:FkbM family methyltransferase